MPQKQIPNILLAVFLLVAFIGFADAAYLTAKHYVGEIPPCSLVSGCETVLTSPYATLGDDVPIALVGSLYYLVLFIGGIIYSDTENTAVLKATARFTTAGFITSLILMNLQIFIIRAWCLYCVISIITSVILFILGIIILKKLKRIDIVETMPTLMQ